MYKIMDPDYVYLNYVYEKEKKQARKDHRLRKGDSQMQLTSQLGLQSGPSNQAAILRVYLHRDEKGHLMKYTIVKNKLFFMCCLENSQSIQ